MVGRDDWAIHSLLTIGGFAGRQAAHLCAAVVVVCLGASTASAAITATTLIVGGSAANSRPYTTGAVTDNLAWGNDISPRVVANGVDVVVIDSLLQASGVLHHSVASGTQLFLYDSRQDSARDVLARVSD